MDVDKDVGAGNSHSEENPDDNEKQELLRHAAAVDRANINSRCTARKYDLMIGSFANSQKKYIRWWKHRFFARIGALRYGLAHPRPDGAIRSFSTIHEIAAVDKNRKSVGRNCLIFAPPCGIRGKGFHAWNIPV